MNDVAHIDTTDTLRPARDVPGIEPTFYPPPPPMPTLKRARSRPKTFPVIVRCETEEQRAMLVDWLAEAGFNVEPRA
jgi:hypothetical protein